MTADLTPAQAARLEAIEAAPYAEEAAVERVARAIHDVDLTVPYGCPWPCPRTHHFRRLAVAAIDVMRGATDDGAVGRCGETEPSIVGEQTGHCALPAGHAGWHRSDDGAEWTYGDDRG